MCSYLQIKSVLGQEKTIESHVFQGQAQEDQEFTEDKKSFISIPKERTGDDPTFGKGRTGSINQLQKNPRDPRNNKKRGKENPIGTDHTNKDTGSTNLSLQTWKVCSIWPGILWRYQKRKNKG
ncbi:hypothetical protein O181_002455 [Austropuccinia psidii MF-1]|uniref:Uncharacterized protein n=1 Tax=Austropuccinia psidii MF-1 TaxID=1389203 RepID=A0A9Q3BCH3_9BASI|nr:hypothetical protein [Austropuccinia psidii MF-1]